MFFHNPSGVFLSFFLSFFERNIENGCDFKRVCSKMATTMVCESTEECGSTCEIEMSASMCARNHDHMIIIKFAEESRIDASQSEGAQFVSQMLDNISVEERRCNL